MQRNSIKEENDAVIRAIFINTQFFPPYITIVYIVFASDWSFLYKKIFKHNFVFVYILVLNFVVVFFNYELPQLVTL